MFLVFSSENSLATLYSLPFLGVNNSYKERLKTYGKGEMPIALVDDVTGELDEVNKQKFFILLERAEQVFFTFTEPQNISENQQLIEL